MTLRNRRPGLPAHRRRPRPSPATTRRRPRPSRYASHPVTVCIAIASQKLNLIITVSDTKASGGSSSVEGLGKVRLLTDDGRWWCMFAGDVGRFSQIHERAMTILRQGDQRVNRVAVSDALRQAYAAELSQMAGDYLRPFEGLHAFELEGRARFGDDLFQKFVHHIRALDTEVEILVLGFAGGYDIPVLMTMSGRGEIQPEELTYTAIGSGSEAAIVTLDCNSEFTHSSDIGEIVYRICAAKFTAEVADGVGKDTVVAIFQPDGPPTAWMGDSLEQARALWQRRLTAKIPDKLADQLRDSGTPIPRRGAPT